MSQLMGVPNAPRRNETSQTPWAMVSDRFFIGSELASFPPVQSTVVDQHPQNVYAGVSDPSQVFVPLGCNNIVQLRCIAEAAAIAVVCHVYLVSQEIGSRARPGKATGVGYSIDRSSVLQWTIGAKPLLASHPWGEMNVDASGDPAPIDPTTLLWGDTLTISNDFAFGGTVKHGTTALDGIETGQFDYTGHCGLLLVLGSAVAANYNIAYRTL